MLYNLIVMEEHTGINICTLVLADRGSIDEDSGCLASGMVKAIRDFLRELKFGRIKSFITHEKQVIIYKEEEILSALICDENDNSELYYPKIKKIAEIFNDVIRGRRWNGEISIFDDAISTSRQIIKLSEKEIVEYIHGFLIDLMSKFSDLYGYSIYLKVNNTFEEEKKYFKDIDNFEIMGLIQSKMLNVISKNCKSYEDIISNSLEFRNIKSIYLNYGRIALFVNFFMENIYSVIYVPGTVNPLEDLEELKSELKKVGEF